MGAFPSGARVGPLVGVTVLSSWEAAIVCVPGRGWSAGHLWGPVLSGWEAVCSWGPALTRSDEAPQVGPLSFLGRGVWAGTDSLSQLSAPLTPLTPCLRTPLESGSVGGGCDVFLRAHVGVSLPPGRKLWLPHLAADSGTSQRQIWAHLGEV